MAIEVFQIEWTKLQPLDKALTQAIAQEGGVYIIVESTTNGMKPLYIGKTTSFYNRSSTHRNYASHLTVTKSKKYSISFGIISCFDKSHISHDITPEQLKEIESFFINEFKPHGNDLSTKKGYKGQPIIIFNSGARLFASNILTNCPDLVKILKKKLR